MNHDIVREQTQALKKELAAIHCANAQYLTRKRRSQPHKFQHQGRLDRLQGIVEQLGLLEGRSTTNARLARETFAVRFAVHHEANGIVLTYSLAGPSRSASVSSHHYESSASLINALSDMRLPGREIEAGGNPDRVFVVGAVQLEILNLTVPE